MKSKNKPAAGGGDQSKNVYARRGPAIPRTLGANLNHDHPVIPSAVNVRTLAAAIPRASIRTRDSYDYNPKTGVGKMVKVHEDVLLNAQRHITAGRIRPVTDGARQRFREKENNEDGSFDKCFPSSFGYSSVGYNYCPPTPLAGSLLSGNKGKRKPRY